jgi:hypothetical protein
MDLGRWLKVITCTTPFPPVEKTIRLDSPRIHPSSTKEGKQLIPNFLQVILAKVEFPNFGWT